MAPRPFWKGYLKLSLVTCAVELTPATSESEKVRFHTLSRKTGNRVEAAYVDSGTGERVEEDDRAKGYERGEDDLVLLDDEDFEDVALESTRTIDIDVFVPADSIGWIWLDRPHYMRPRDEVGVEAFAVIRDAMRSTGTAGIARLVMYRRERAVMVAPRDRGIVLWTLRYGDEVRPADDTFRDLPSAKPPAAARKLVDRLIAERTGPWNPALVSDPVQERLLEIIAARKGRGKRRQKPAPEPRADNVVDIMDALRRSISAEGKAAPGRGRTR